MWSFPFVVVVSSSQRTVSGLQIRQCDVVSSDAISQLNEKVAIDAVSA